MSNQLPRIGERLFEVINGVPTPTPAYYRFWQGLTGATVNGVTGAEFKSLLIYLGSDDGTISGLPPFNPGGGIPSDAKIIGGQSVETNGLLSNGVVLINLLNDVDVAAPTNYYGADATGEKGWFPIADAFTASPEITLTVGLDGITDVSITPVPDSGTGDLLAITRNGLGQVTGTRTPSADDLAEGVSNLYFTNERAQDAVGGIVANSANVSLTYSDATPSLIADLIDTAVAPGTYGDARHISVFTVDQKGRLTAASLKPVSTFDSTGLISGGALSINGGDNTKFDLSAGVAVYIDHTTPEEPEQILVPFGPFTAVAVTNIATQLVTYIGIDAAGAIIQSTTPFSNTQRRTIAFVGVVVHSNNVNLNAINVIGATARAGVNQLHDLMDALGPLNLAGNVFGPNGANLLLNRSAGRVFKFGANFQASSNDPHVVSLAGATGLTFRYRLSDGTEFSDRTTIDPAQYESAPGVLSAMPAPPVNCSVQRINIFQTGLCRIQYGQTVYGSFSDAESALLTDSFSIETNIAENGIFRAYLIVSRGATDLSDSGQAKFVPIGKFGAPASGGAALTSAAIIAALGYTPFNEADYHPLTMSRVSLRF